MQSSVSVGLVKGQPVKPHVYTPMNYDHMASHRSALILMMIIISYYKLHVRDLVMVNYYNHHVCKYLLLQSYVRISLIKCHMIVHMNQLTYCG